ncbi:MAG TPA: chorismate-binding protein, partial [Candidatus Caenarcaniphilales bacterium]
MSKLQPWHWRSLPLENRSGSVVFAALFRQLPVATLLESPNQASSACTPQARYSICAGAPRWLQGHLQMWAPPAGKVLACLRYLLSKTSSREGHPPLPFTGGWLGWLGYDLAWEIEQLPYLRQDPLPFPLAYWYEPECFAVLDHQAQQLWLAATDESQLDLMQQALLKVPVACLDWVSPGVLLPAPIPRFHTSQADYEAMVCRAQQFIQAGDIFQANLSLRFEAHTDADAWSIYQALQQINPAPFSSYWQTPWGAVVSCSPERLVSLQGRQVQTRPIAGTRSRGNTPNVDHQQAQDLLNSEKDNA